MDDQELTKLFAATFPQIVVNDDSAIFEQFADIRSRKPVTYGALAQFIAADDSYLQAIVRQKHPIFRHPVILPIFYYVVYADTFLREYWPLDNRLLEAIYHSIGYSYQDY